jgi:integrase
VAAAGITDKRVTPHTLRHTSATWLMQAGVDRWQAAGLLGMSVEVLEQVYGHHHPDYQSEAAESLAGQKSREQNATNSIERHENC